MIRKNFSHVLTVLMMTAAVASADDYSITSREVPVEDRLATKAARDDAIEASMKKNDTTAEALQGSLQLAKGLNDNYSVKSHSGAFHSPVGISFLGDFLELEDGSIWNVKPTDAFVVRGWNSSDVVVLTQNKNSWWGYEYCITNQISAESVEVNFCKSQTIQVQVGYTRWIDFIDRKQRIIYLNDGTYWQMSFFDASIVKKWTVGDIVIIGINDGWLKSSNPNILINANTCEWAAGAVY